MNKKFSVLTALLLVFTLVLTACTPNMKAYMAKSEELKNWGPTKGSYDITMDMSVKDETTNKEVNFTMPGKITIELEDQENGKFDYQLNFSEIKKAMAAEDPEEAAKMPETLTMEGYVKGTKVIFNKSIFTQMGTDANTAVIDDIKEKYIALDMGGTFLPTGTANEKAIEYLQSAEFTSDMFKLMDVVFKDYVPVVDYVIEGNTFTYEATIEDLSAETIGMFKAVKKNWTPFVEQLKPIMQKVVSETEIEAVDEGLKAFEEIIKEVSEEDLKEGVDGLKEMLKGSKIKLVEEFKDDEVIQDISYVINVADVMNMKFAMKGSMKKVDSVNIVYPTDVKNITFEEYIAMFMPVQEAAVLVSYNDEPVEFDTMPIIEDGRTLVPFRALLEKLGATVEWDEENQVVTATKGEDVIKLTIGKDVALVNDKEVKLDAPARLEEARTLIPLRFVAETFGFTVDYVRVGNIDFITILSDEYLEKIEKELNK